MGGADKMAKEIAANGPIASGIDAVISVVGWGYDESSDKQYWLVRNSWGEYWGEMGFVRVEKGNNALKLEEQCAYATVGTFTDGNNFPCAEDGTNCVAKDDDFADIM